MKRAVLLGLLLLPLVACSKQTASLIGNDSANERVIVTEAKDGVFTPATLTMKRGERINVNLHVVTGSCAFAAEGLGVVIPSIQGDATAGIAIPTDKPGTFPFSCGSGKGGTIVIQ